MLSKNIAIPIERSRVSLESLHENGANKAFAKLALCKMDMAKVWAEEETGFQRKPGLSFNDYIQPKMDTIASAAIQELVTTSQFTDSYPLELQLPNIFGTLYFPPSARSVVPENFKKIPEKCRASTPLSDNVIHKYPPSPDVFAAFAAYKSSRINWLVEDIVPWLQDHMLSPHADKKVVLCITGMPGSGKTTLATLLKTQLPSAIGYSQEDARYKKSRDERVGENHLLAGAAQYHITKIATDIAQSSASLHIVDGLYSPQLKDHLEAHILSIACVQEDPRSRMIGKLPEKTQIYTALQNLVVFYYAGQEEWPDGNRFTATSDIVLDMTHTDLYFAQQS